MAEKKMTKRESFETLATLMETVETEKKDELVAFLQKEIALIDNRTEKDKERRAKRQVEGDELYKAVEAVLTETPVVAEDIVKAVLATDEEKYADLTKQKVVSRLGQLVKKGIVVKESIKAEDSSRKLMHYSLAGEAAIEDAEADVDEDLE